MKRVAIVGAGISGLSLAFRLQQANPNFEVLVLEEENRTGGKVWTEHLNGFQVEAGPNGFLDNNRSTMDLCHALGLQNQLIPASESAGRNRFLFLNGKLHRLPTSLKELLRSDLLSWRGKLGLLTERLRPRKRHLDEESVAAFARRRAGREIAEILADAGVTGIHAGDPSLLSLPAAFPRLTALEQQYGSILKGLAQTGRKRRADAVAKGQPLPLPNRMWSMVPGLRLLIETLGKKLSRPPLLGVQVRNLTRIPNRNPEDPGWVLQGQADDSWKVDAVVLACPAYRQASILGQLDSGLADLVGAIAYNRVVVVALGFRRADVPGTLDGFGYIAPQRTGRDVLGVQWCSSIFPSRAPEGTVLLRALCGGWGRPEVAGWDETKLFEAVCSDLALSMGIRATPLFHHIIRWDRAIPQYHLGHSKRVAQIEQKACLYPGLFLGGNAYHGISLNDCTEQSQVLARQVQQFLASD